MTNAELNEYIKHYIENDKTNSAIMLTAPCGTGKSYYIKNRLIPFLEGKTDAKGNLIIKDDNSTEGIKKTKCIVISLYGIYDIETISKNIYLELRSINVFPDNEVFTTGKVVAKTVLKGLLKTTLNFDVKDYEIEKEDLENIYKSVDLSNILLIFEDIERSNIDIIKFMGYINNLVEQDGVRVLLVTNEAEIIKYKYITIETKKKQIQDKHSSNKKETQRIFTPKTQKYLSIKEKSVIDTIIYSFEYETAIKDVIKEFADSRLDSFITDTNIRDIISIMDVMKSQNLRALKFACQKTMDIFDTFLSDKCYTKKFKEEIFYGSIFIALALKKGQMLKWNGDNCCSTEMFLSGYPISKFCFDYILEQKIDKNLVDQTVKKYDKLRLYNNNKNKNDKDFQVLEQFLSNSEEEVKKAIASIKARLYKHKSEIAFVNYPKIIYCLMELSGYVDDNIQDFIDKMCSYLKEERGELPSTIISRDLPKYKGMKRYDTYKEIIGQFVSVLENKESFLESFDYNPEKAEDFYNDTLDRKSEILKEHSFTKKIDNSKIVEMFIKSTQEQMNYIRYAFIEAYTDAPNDHYFSADKEDIQQIYDNINSSEIPIDAIKRMQRDMFLKNLKSIISDM